MIAQPVVVDARSISDEDQLMGFDQCAVELNVAVGAKEAVTAVAGTTDAAARIAFVTRRARAIALRWPIDWQSDLKANVL